MFNRNERGRGGMGWWLGRGLKGGNVRSSQATKYELWMETEWLPRPAAQLDGITSNTDSGKILSLSRHEGMSSSIAAHAVLLLYLTLLQGEYRAGRGVLS
jgi:hypothetical protein